MGPGGFRGLQNRCDLTVSGRVGSIPIHSRQHASRAGILLSIRVTLAFSRAAVAGRFATRVTGLLALLAALLPATAMAQRADSARVAAAPSIAADSLRPPISPRRAFLYSFLAPGYGQARLGRHKAAALTLLFEGVCLSMIRESAADLREARRSADDTLVTSWTGSSGLQRTLQTAPRFTIDDVRSRRRHEEDWIALLIANHLFAGADAFVAANLWDLPAQLSLRATPDRTALVASVSW